MKRGVFASQFLEKISPLNVPSGKFDIELQIYVSNGKKHFCADLQGVTTQFLTNTGIQLIRDQDGG